MPSETLSLTIGLEVGAGLFNFDYYNPPLDLRKAFPAKDKYKEGEIVYIHFCVKNNGTATATGKIDVKDLDTGATLTSWAIPATDPGWRYKTDPAGSGARVGAMPNKNWRLSLVLTP